MENTKKITVQFGRAGPLTAKVYELIHSGILKRLNWEPKKGKDCLLKK